MTVQEMICVLQAFERGETIQYRRLEFSNNETCWFDLRPVGGMFNCNFADYEYRVKPKPREFWVNKYSNDRTASFTAYPTKEDADRFAFVSRIACIHVQEVIE